MAALRILRRITGQLLFGPTATLDGFLDEHRRRTTAHDLRDEVL